MATILKHRKTRIVTIEAGDSVASQCRPGDIAIVEEDNGWWTFFIGEDGTIDKYDEPFVTYNQALWAAKAAAEFAAE